ncbi:MAG: hypothetical protein ACAH59_09455 [Pseudobdellovibrionaceae bacterium]
MKFSQEKMAKSGLLILLMAFLFLNYQNCAGNFQAANPDASQSDLDSTGQGSKTMSVVLAWDKSSSTSTQIRGYRIYLGENPGVYSRVIDVGLPANANMPEYEILNLSPNKRYYAVVKAYDTNAKESTASNEIEISGD